MRALLDLQWFLGYLFFGEVEVEIGDLHCPDFIRP